MLRSALTLIMLTALASPVWAQPDTHGKGSGGHGNKPPGGALFNAPMKRLAKRLDLSAEQQAKLTTVRSDYTASIAKQWAEVKRIKGKMRALWTSGDVPKKADVQALQSQMRANRMPIADKMVDAKLRAIAILTPEQRRQMASMHGGGKGKGKGKGKGSRTR